MLSSHVRRRAFHLAGTALLAVARPFQRFCDQVRPTHAFLNGEALDILRRDGLRAEAAFLENYRSELDAGNYWADAGWKNVTHMYDPLTGLGFGAWPNATEACTTYWAEAMRAWRRREFSVAAFHLGAACHIVQDLCVPHHAAARLFSGHVAFENLAARRFHRYSVRRGGLYHVAATPAEWVAANAREARSYLCMVTPPHRLGEPELALADLLPLAQRTTAGFLAQFLAKAHAAHDALLPGAELAQLA